MKSYWIILLFITVEAAAQMDTSHHVPGNKRLPDNWKAGLMSQARAPFSGKELTTIGMPCGGIASGQLYVRGDGTLAGWWIANNAYNTGYGAKELMQFNTALGPWKVCYQTFTPVSYIDQGFTIKVGKGRARSLDKEGFDDIRFVGEYPIATIHYTDRASPLPVDVQLRVFSPFIPLDARESATPGTIMQYRLTNTSGRAQRVTLTGRLQNLVGLDGRMVYHGTSRNRIIQQPGMSGVEMDLVKTDLPVMHPWNGNMALTLLSDHGFSRADVNRSEVNAEKPPMGAVEKLLGIPLTGAVGTTVDLQPGETKQLTFLVTWFFPNRPAYIDVNWNQPLSVKGDVIGNNYANWFGNSVDVAAWLKDNLGRLSRETFAFHDTYYDQSTIPYWLNRRLLMPVSTLATETCQWWGTGKFWGWEGVGSCVGTCTHVWNYEQGLAHLFPELERNIREQTDFATSFHPDGGIDTRNGGGGIAIDGQAGTVLKAYREYLLSNDPIFLTRNWTRIKAAMEYLIRMDGNGDGLIEGVQPNTYDIAFYGANTYVGSLYLGALRAAGKMGSFMGDTGFADSCVAIADNGSRNSAQKLYNGEYFIQDVDLKVHPESQVGSGCLSDQLFGQTWADLTGLGPLYPEEEIRSALQSIWNYNWAPDVGVQNRYHPPERDFADSGEAGLLICTWPHSPHPGEKGVRYRDEVWTGIEYQVATSMIYAGMWTEGLSIVKGLDERYQPEKHNPWNEIECGDHYARAMASWGVLLALEDFRYNGPEERMGFAPKIQADHFRGFFSAAQGWGTIGQERSRGAQENTVSLRYGRLALKTLELEIAGGSHYTKVRVRAGKQTLTGKAHQEGNNVIIDLPQVQLHAGEQLTINLTTI